MDSKPLEQKSLTELRSIAQAMGIKPEWSWDIPKLVKKIRESARPTIAAAQTEEFEQHGIMLLVKDLSTKEIAKALDRYKERGLEYSFKDDKSIHLTVTIKREDSCSRQVPLKTLIVCAKKLING